MRSSHVSTFVVGAASLLVVACGGPAERSTDRAPEGTSAAPPAPTAAAEPTIASDPVAPESGATTLPPTAAIDSYSEVQPAVIQLDVRGTFRDPEIGLAWGGFRGSGFIISPDGLAVTNNHVVTGAAAIEVYIGGDRTRAYNASLVGVSECNDLALLRIDTRETLPYLAWAAEAPPVGTEVFAAGFPLGDPEYTMTRGIVAKAKHEIHDLVVSVDWAIEHDANLQPGNSGGPLVDAAGRLVGVNFYAPNPTNTAQFFAISSELAQEVVERLRGGDFESLGINGIVVWDDTTGLTGVWVSGTAPGSPASNAGILPGDIVTALNGLPIGTDGTMKDYCDVIRTAGDRPIHVQVLRWDTQVVLEGEINGELPLAPM